MLNADNLIDQLESIHDTLATLSGRDQRPLTPEDVSNVKLFANIANDLQSRIENVRVAVTERINNATEEVINDLVKAIAQELSGLINTVQKMAGSVRYRRQAADLAFLNEIQAEVTAITSGAVDAASVAALEPVVKHIESMTDTLNKFAQAGVNKIEGSSVDIKNLNMLDKAVGHVLEVIREGVANGNQAASTILGATGGVDSALKQIAATNIVDVSGLQKQLDFSDIEKAVVTFLDDGNSLLTAAAQYLDNLRVGNAISLTPADLLNLNNMKGAAQSMLGGLQGLTNWSFGSSRMRRSAEELAKIGSEANGKLNDAVSDIISTISRLRRNPEQLREVVNVAAGLAATGGLNVDTLSSLAEHYVKRDLLNLNEEDVIANLTAELEEDDDEESEESSSSEEDKPNDKRELQQKIQPGVLTCVQNNKGREAQVQQNLTECNTKVVEDQCPSKQSQQ